LTQWDDTSTSPPRVGYEVPFYREHVDAGELCRRGDLTQREIEEFQNTLAETLLQLVHETVPPTSQPLSRHMASVVPHAFAALEADPALARLIGAEAIDFNGEPMAGPRVAFARLLAAPGALAALDAEPQVRLHGDLFLENVLWRSRQPTRESRSPSGDPPESPRLLLIDPVSVAGVVRGPPLFDIVKFESYATGELHALRSGRVEVGGFTGTNEYHYRVPWEDSALAPFRKRNWHALFRQRFEARNGLVNPRLYHLIDGYFSVVMAVSIDGVQRQARLLKATRDFNVAAASPR
jgi:hypothetical protein